MRKWINERFSALGAWFRRFFRAIVGTFVELPPERPTLAPPPDSRGWEWLRGSGTVEASSAIALELPPPPQKKFPDRIRDEVATLRVVSQELDPLDEGTVPPFIKAEFGISALGHLPLGDDVPVDEVNSSMEKLGEGNEAVVYRVKRGRGRGHKSETFAFKQFHTPESPAYAGSTPDKKLERENAARRMIEYPQKLRQFPALPPRVVAPKHIVTDGRKVVGYLMPLVEFSFPLTAILEGEERRKRNISMNDVVEIFLDIHDTIRECHRAGIVIGDLKPENLLCSSKAVYLVDAESMKFGPWQCWKFTDVWADPQICDPNSEFPSRTMDPTPDSDWFIFASMLLNALVGAGPYDGTLIKGKKLVQPWERAKKGLSIFQKGVIVPQFVKSEKNLSKNLVALFTEIFEGGRRGEFPRQILEEMLWTECSCGEEFCGVKCGKCGMPRLAKLPRRFSAVSKPLAVDGKGCIEGTVLATAFHGEKLQALVFRDGVLYREDGVPVGKINPDAYNAYLVLGRCSALVANGTCIILDPEGSAPRKIEGIDQGLTGSPLVAGADKTLAMVVNGTLHIAQLEGEGRMESLMEVPDKGVLWMGEGFGLLLTDKPGSPFRLFSFESNGRVEEVQNFPEINGAVVEASACFGTRTSWLAIRTSEMGRDLRYLIAVDRGGELVSWTKASDREIPEWFQSVGAKAAVDDGERRILLAGTRSGMYRLEVIGEKIVREGIVTGFSVSPDAQIYPHAGGLYEVTPSGIRSHKLASLMKEEADASPRHNLEEAAYLEDDPREGLRLSN